MGAGGERERDLHGTFHPGRCGVINHRTRPKSCATAEACVVLRTEFADIRLRVFKLHRHFHDFFCLAISNTVGTGTGRGPCEVETIPFPEGGFEK